MEVKMYLTRGEAVLRMPDGISAKDVEIIDSYLTLLKLSMSVMPQQQVGQQSSLSAKKPVVGELVTKVCARPACGQKFSYRKGKGMARKYCSKDCQMKMMLERSSIGDHEGESEAFDDARIPRTANG